MKQPASSFAKALRFARRARGLPQEQFDSISSRTYVSSLERGIKQPTLPKIDALAGVLKLHPLTLLLFCYVGQKGAGDVRRLLARVDQEADDLLRASADSGEP